MRLYVRCGVKTAATSDIDPGTGHETEAVEAILLRYQQTDPPPAPLHTHPICKPLATQYPRT
jgi:hypothetical protein